MGTPPLTGKVYAGHTVPLRVNHGGDTDTTVDTGDPADIDGTDAPAVPQFIGFRLEGNVNKNFSLVSEVVIGNVSPKIQPEGLKTDAPFTKAPIHFPELSAGFSSDPVHAKAGIFASPFTGELAYLDELGRRTHSGAFRKVALNFTGVQLGAGNDILDVTLHFNGGPDNLKISQNNFSGGFSFKMTPPEFELDTNLFFGEKDGEPNGLFEVLVKIKGAKVTFSLDTFMGWQFAPAVKGVEQKQQWESVIASLSAKPFSFPLMATLWGEYLHNETGGHQGHMALALQYPIWSILNTKGDDNTLVVNGGAEYRHDWSADQQQREVVSLGVDAVYKF